jgi:hypothetical protein
MAVLLAAFAMSACAHGARIGSGGNGSGGTSPASTGTAATNSSSTGPVACTGAQGCTSLNDNCHVGSCVSGVCEAMPANEGLACTPTDKCTSAMGATCKSGVCSGPPVSCAMLNDTCNVGMCDPMQGCVKSPTNNGGACDDGKFCTTNDVCTNGTCAGTPMMCPPPAAACQVGQCDEASMGCINVPGNNGATCNPGNACIMNATCSSGMCGGGQPITACVSGDGCCPAGCNATNDSDCANCTTNIALTATASDSGGGVTSHGPQDMNNGAAPNCTTFAWITNNTTPSGAWIELDWPSAVLVGSFYIETDNGLTPMCFGTGRNVASGTVQTWNGSTWVTSGTFSGQHGNVQFNLVPAVVTTKLRVFNVTTDPGNGNSIIFQWHVYTGKSCTPPP